MSSIIPMIEKSFRDHFLEHGSVPIAIKVNPDTLHEILGHVGYLPFSYMGTERDTFMGMDLRIVYDLDSPYSLIPLSERKPTTYYFIMDNGLLFVDDVFEAVYQLRSVCYTNSHVISMNEKMKNDFWIPASEFLLNRMTGVDGVIIDNSLPDGRFEVMGE